MTKRKALRELQEAAILRAVKRASEKHAELLKAWQVERIMTTARLLEIPVEQVTPQHVWWCHALHGQPSMDPPRITDVPLDGRTRRSFVKLGLAAPKEVSRGDA